MLSARPHILRYLQFATDIATSLIGIIRWSLDFLILCVQDLLDLVHELKDKGLGREAIQEYRELSCSFVLRQAYFSHYAQHAVPLHVLVQHDSTFTSISCPILGSRAHPCQRQPSSRIHERP
jgi:hypothetical protein